MPQVNLLVADELLPDLPQALELLKASELARQPSEHGCTLVTLDLPYAPDGAELVDARFEHTPNGVRVQSLSWRYPA